MKKFDQEELIQIRNVLQNTGLDAKEADVYLALLTAKSSAVSDLGKTISYPRTTLYFILDRLHEKGLVSFMEKGKIRHFVAEPPERLIFHAQEEQKKFLRVEQQLHEALPLLNALVKPNSAPPTVKLHHGLKGLKQIYKELHECEFMGIFNPDIMYEALEMTATELIFDKKFPLTGRDLITQSKHTEDYIKDYQVTPNYDYRLLPKELQFYCDVVIWNDNIAFFTYDQQHTIIQLQNERIAQMMRMTFEGLWTISESAK